MLYSLVTYGVVNRYQIITVRSVGSELRWEANFITSAAGGCGYKETLNVDCKQIVAETLDETQKFFFGLDENYNDVDYVFLLDGEEHFFVLRTDRKGFTVDLF